jgi:hypothetical protein
MEKENVEGIKSYLTNVKVKFETAESDLAGFTEFGVDPESLPYPFNEYRKGFYLLQSSIADKFGRFRHERSGIENDLIDIPESEIAANHEPETAVITGE